MSSVSRQPDSSAQAEAPNSTTPNEGSSSKTTVEKQTTLSLFIARPTSFARQKRFNNMLLKMIVKDRGLQTTAREVILSGPPVDFQ